MARALFISNMLYSAFSARYRDIGFSARRGSRVQPSAADVFSYLAQKKLETITMKICKYSQLAAAIVGETHIILHLLAVILRH